MTDYKQELNEVMANNKNLFASTGATGKAFLGVHEEAIKLGATRDEIVETINVAIMMGGGPSTVYGGKALACADQFLQE